MTTCVRAAESDRWQALFESLPPLPATSAQALSKVAGRRVDGRLRIEIADEPLRVLQREIDALYEPSAQASSAQMRRQLETIEQDPEMARLARRIDETIGPERLARTPPTAEERRRLAADVESILGPGAMSRDPPPVPLSDIAAYRLELQRTPPRSGQFLQQLFLQRRRYAEQHAQVDRDAMAGGMSSAAAAIARHHALAAQQLSDAAATLAAARDALRPRFERMAALARAAELRAAPPVERAMAYAVLKAYLEMLLTIQRDTLEDVGFWSGVRVRPPVAGASVVPSSYEHALAPEIDLRANGELPTAGPQYPAGRAIVVGLPPGIR